jgi:uncharacterized protein YceK
MRALVISTVIGALALSGCQSMNTGTNSGATGSSGGFRDYQKTAIGAGLGALAGYGLSRAGANSSAQNNRAAAIGALLVLQVVCILIKKSKNFASKWQVQVLK